MTPLRVCLACVGVTLYDVGDSATPLTFCGGGVAAVTGTRHTDMSETAAAAAARRLTLLASGSGMPILQTHTKLGVAAEAGSAG